MVHIVRVRHATFFVSFADLLQYFSLANMIRQCCTNWHLSVTLTPVDPNETGDSIQTWVAEPKSRINIWALQNCGRKTISVQDYIMSAACHILILFLIAATDSYILLRQRMLANFLSRLQTRSLMKEEALEWLPFWTGTWNQFHAIFQLHHRQVHQLPVLYH